MKNCFGRGDKPVSDVSYAALRDSSGGGGGMSGYSGLGSGGSAVVSLYTREGEEGGRGTFFSFPPSS